MFEIIVHMAGLLLCPYRMNNRMIFMIDVMWNVWMGVFPI